MDVAIVSGVFAIALALISWLLTNSSKRGRLLARIQHQVAALKDLPGDHPARAELDRALLADATELSALAARRSPEARREGPSRRESIFSEARVFRFISMALAIVSAVFALISVINALAGHDTTIRITP